RRHRGRRGGRADEATGSSGAGAGGDAPRSGGRLRRPALGGAQEPGRRTRAQRVAARHRRGARGRDRAHARRRTLLGHRARAGAAAGRRSRARGAHATAPLAHMSDAPSPAAPPTREVVLVTGISGSGKSVALHALEDAGYFCVDNLPPELLREFVRLEHARDTHRIAVAVDVRAARSLPALVPLMDEMRGDGILMRSSETRRPHPLANPLASDNQTALVEAIELERLLLGELREVSTVIDTSQ